MKAIFCRIALLTAAALTLTFVACKDDEDFGISQAEVDLDTTDVGQLEAESQVIPFNLQTDKDAEWTATVEWDEENAHQLAYVYPEAGTGPALLKLVSLPNTTEELRYGTLKITFPRDASKNISIPLTQQRAEIVNGEAQVSGDRARAIGFGYNAFLGYCDLRCVQAPILAVQQMYDEDRLVYDFSQLKVDQREESGASAEELARKLNTSAHAGVNFMGFFASVDAEFNIGQKQTTSNEFAWMDINVRSALAALNGSPQTIIRQNMLKEAYNSINGVPVTVREKKRVAYPSTDEGFRELVLDYGTHLVVGGYLGGQVRTSVVANTSRITSAYNASVALKAGYSSDWLGIDANAGAKAQQSAAVSRHQSAFFFRAKLRGGGADGKTVSRLNAVLDKMNAARQGLNTESDAINETLDNATIEDYTKEYSDAFSAWKEGFRPKSSSLEDHAAALKNIVLVDFVGDNNLVPLYELIDRDATIEKDGFDGEQRYREFRFWYENNLMTDPGILNVRPKLSSYISVPPTKVDPMNALTKARNYESLVQDIYLTNGAHVARICSEFIPDINPSKRVNVIYPIAGGKVRYNQGLFCGDEASYPAQVSWGAADPTRPIVTTMDHYEKGQRAMVYLRGYHLTLDPDTSFKEKDYFTTVARPYVLQSGNISYNTVKINDYIYTRTPWRGTTFNNGTSYRQASSDYHEGGSNRNYYRVKTYSRYQKAFGGFAPQGWGVPYQQQYQTMMDMLGKINGGLPDGTVGKSFTRDGVFGFLPDWTGFYLADNEIPADIKNQTVCNPDFVYYGCLCDEDLHFWDDVVNDSKNNSTTDARCPALVANAKTGTASIAWWDSNTNNHVSVTDWDKSTWKNPMNRDPDGFLVKNEYYSDVHRRGYYVYMPVVLCEKTIK